VLGNILSVREYHITPKHEGFSAASKCVLRDSLVSLSLCIFPLLTVFILLCNGNCCLLGFARTFFIRCREITLICRIMWFASGTPLYVDGRELFWSFFNSFPFRKYMSSSRHFVVETPLPNITLIPLRRINICVRQYMVHQEDKSFYLTNLNSTRAIAHPVQECT
jgi:hypothetical protein